MTIRVSKLSISNHQFPSINTKITKTLDELLAKVNQGSYEDFREWFAQSGTKNLDLSKGKAKAVNLSHLGKALQNTNVTQVNLMFNAIGAQGAKDFAEALKDTNVTQVNLGSNVIGTQGAKDFAEALKGTLVTEVDLSFNEIDAQGAKDFAKALKGTAVTQVTLARNKMGPQGAKDFAEGLKGTAVTQVDLGSSGIGDQGAKDFAEGLKGSDVARIALRFNKISSKGAIDVIAALEGSNVSSLNLLYNDFTDATALDIAAKIEKTNLLELTLPFTHAAITKALKKNQDRILITPYEAARLYFLPQNTKEKMIPKATFTLSENASNEEQIQYAGGILANPRMPLEIAQKIVSFLPMMNANKVRYIFNAAAKKPPVFEETEKAPVESKKPILAKSKH